MEELNDKDKPNKTKALRRIAAVTALFFFITLYFNLSEYLKDYVSPFTLLLPAWLLFWNVQYFLDKEQPARFELKDWLKANGLYILIILFLYNLFTFMISAAESVPESVASWFTIILIVGSVLFLIGGGFYFIEKHSKP